MVETVVTVERTTSTQQTSAPAGGGGGLSALHINIGYFRTVPGIIKLVQFIFGLLCMILASPTLAAATVFFMFVAVVSFISTVLWIFAYFVSLRAAVTNVNWIFTELINTAIAALLYFIAFVVQLSVWSAYPGHDGYSSHIAAGVFGLFNFLAYAAGTYFLFVEQRNG